MTRTEAWSSVLPVYVVIDTSASLMGIIDDVNQALAGLVDQLGSDAQISSKVRISIVSFSDQARLEMPMSTPSSETVPLLAAQGSTDYGSALRFIKELIPADIGRLKSEGERVYRPIMYFITDGMPVDQGWRNALDELEAESFGLRPTIVAMGFGSADPTVLRVLAGDVGHAFLVSQALEQRDAVQSIFVQVNSALRSTVASSTAGRAGPPISLPDTWIDVTRVSAEDA
jgi:uncharacterized protein YegL